MPIIDAQDARDLDSHLQRFFDSTPAERPLRLRQLFTQKFDFNPATGKVSLAEAPQNVSLPSDADRSASFERINVIYVPLQIPGTTRVRKAEVAAAARLIAGQLGDDMLLLMTNEQTDKVLQLHVILPTFMGSTPALRRMVIERDLPRRTALQQLSNIDHQWKKAIRDNGKELALTMRRYAPFIVSGNIRPFRHTWETEKVRYIKDTYQHPVIDKNHRAISPIRRSPSDPGESGFRDSASALR